MSKIETFHLDAADVLEIVRALRDGSPPPADDLTAFEQGRRSGAIDALNLLIGALSEDLTIGADGEPA